MTLLDSVKSVRITDAGVFIPPGAESWLVFQGTNSKTGVIDTLVAIYRAERRNMQIMHYDLYRWSGKNQVWCKVPETYTLTEIESYGTVPNAVRLIAHVDPKLPAVTNPGATTSTTVPKKEKEKAMNLNKIFGRFGKAPKGEFAMSIGGGIAIKRKSGGYSTLVGDTLTNVDDLAFDIDAFFFIPTTPDQLQPNDVVVTGADGGLGYVVNVDDKNTVKVYDVNTESFRCVRPSTHFLMKSPFVTKVFGLLNDGGGMSPMLLLLLMGGLDGDDKKDGGKDKSDLMLLLLLSGGLGGCCGGNTDSVGGINPLMLMLLMKSNEGFENPNDEEEGVEKVDAR